MRCSSETANRWMLLLLLRPPPVLLLLLSVRSFRQSRSGESSSSEASAGLQRTSCSQYRRCHRRDGWAWLVAMLIPCYSDVQRPLQQSSCRHMRRRAESEKQAARRAASFWFVRPHKHAHRRANHGVCLRNLFHWIRLAPPGRASWLDSLMSGTIVGLRSRDNVSSACRRNRRRQRLLTVRARI